MGKTYRYQPSKFEEDKRAGKKEKRERTNNRRIGKMKGFDDPFVESFDDEYGDDLDYIDRR